MQARNGKTKHKTDHKGMREAYREKWKGLHDPMQMSCIYCKEVGREEKSVQCVQQEETQSSYGMYCDKEWYMTAVLYLGKVGERLGD